MRQWVLSVPFPLRFLFASQPKIMGKALGIVYRTIATHLARYLERQGLLERDAEHSYLTLDNADEDSMDQLRGLFITYRIAVGSQQGRKALPCKRRRMNAMPMKPRRPERWLDYSGHPALRPSGQPSAVQNRSRRFCLPARRIGGQSQPA